MEHSRENFADPEDAGAWMAADGPDHEVVVTSRIRVARNVDGYPFKACLGEDEGEALASTLSESLARLKVAEDQCYVNLARVEPLDRELLLERHLISVEMARGEGPRGVVYSQHRHLSMMVNEEDHLRVQVLSPGCGLADLLEVVRLLDEEIGQEVAYARHPRFGYLTSCPTNVGTGMRLSVMLHLPALVFSKEIEKEFNAAQKMRMAVRGFYGEGTQFLGDFFQVSNQVTLGKTEEELLNDLLKVIPTIVEHELEVRRLMQKDHTVELEDKVFRAFGLLSHSRKMTSQEALELLSQVRLGVCLGMLDSLDLRTVNELLVMTQPAHVQVLAARKLDEDERDVARAEYVRRRLAGPSSGTS